MRATEFRHSFIEYMPSQLEPATLYVSLRFNTASHLCACGCGRKVVTPLHPTRWSLSYDGQALSLSPSIGNWHAPCRSHYWITHGRVAWAPAWSSQQVSRGLDRDRLDYETWEPASSTRPRSVRTRIAAWTGQLLGRRPRR